MKVVILSGGEIPTYDMIKNELKDSSYLICADSGANCAYKYNITPDLIIGDLDSIKDEALSYFKNKNTNILKFPREKDFTDTEIAVNKAIELEAEEIIILGATGNRIDHLLGNLGMLLKCLKLGVNAIIKDRYNVIKITDKPIVIKGNKGDTFSLAAYYSNVTNLSIMGAKYPLKNFYLKIGEPIATSNEFLNNEVKINFDEGILLIIYPVC